ncbi:hypothetical protein LguiB_023736 [Lonicera macranthoides]
MEVNKSLQILSQKACYLFDRVNDEIYKYNESTSSFCRVCSENDRYCKIGETPLRFEESEILITIRDSMKDAENMLILLQNLKLRQQRELHAAFTRLEESRVFLRQKVKQFPGKGKRVDVIEELNACLHDGKSVFPWKLKEIKMEQKIEKNRISDFLFHCIRSLFSPWNWLSTARVGTKFVVVYASISYVFAFYQTRKNYKSYSRTRNIFSSVDSAIKGKMNRLLLSDPNSPLDVFSGKG